MSDPRARRGLGLALLVVLVAIAGYTVLGRSTSTAGPLPSGDPANGVTIVNAIDSTTVTIVYEPPDGSTQTLTDLPPGRQSVVDAIFAERDGLCRTGRLVALAADGTELDELYLVCRGGSWTVEAD